MFWTPLKFVNSIKSAFTSSSNILALRRTSNHLNILEARNHKSRNLEVRIPVLGNYLFSAWLWFHFYRDIGQDLTKFEVRSSLYQYSFRNYDSTYIKMISMCQTGDEFHSDYSSSILNITKSSLNIPFLGGMIAKPTFFTIFSFCYLRRFDSE